MAKVTITFTDRAEGGVVAEGVFDPPMRKGEALTQAQNVAIEIFVRLNNDEEEGEPSSAVN